MKSDRGFSSVMFEYHSDESKFEEFLVDQGLEFDHIGGDDYDNSIEFYGVSDENVLTPEMQEFIFNKHGFTMVYLNHENGSETHYSQYDGVKNERRTLPIEGRKINYKKAIRDYLFEKHMPPAVAKLWSDLNGGKNFYGTKTEYQSLWLKHVGDLLKSWNR